MKPTLRKALLPIVLICLNWASYAQHFPKVVEELPASAVQLSANGTLNAWYTIIAVDSVYTDLIPSKENEPSYIHYYSFKSNDTIEKKTEPLFLFIDTTQVLSITKQPIWARYLFDINYYEKTEADYDENDTLVAYVQAYPVFMLNINSDTIDLDTQDGSAMMTCEVKNSAGQWIAIEEWKSSWCGNSYYSMTIPPLNVAYTKMLIYKGTIQTVGRLRLRNDNGIIYSNEIEISVNPSQFFEPLEDKEK